MGNNRIKKVLVLCTGNSCRSQIAEAIINHDLRGTWQAFSAGTRPAGFVHPLALKVLSEIGIPHAGRSKSAGEFKTETFDLIVTVCDDASENCPVWLGAGKKIHLGFPDPARASGSEEEKTAEFRRVRDEIRRIIPAYLKSLFDPSQPSA